VAQSVGAKVTTISGMQLIKAQQYQSLGRDFLATAFGAKAGDPFAAGGPGGAFIGRVNSVTPGDATTVASVTNAIRGRVARDYVQDLLDAAKLASERAVKVAINRNLGLKAVGIDPATVAPAPGQPGGKAK
jgi:hypothetical protein